MKSDSKIVMKAVSNNGLSLQFASDDNKGDKNIVKKAIESQCFSLEHMKP